MTPALKAEISPVIELSAVKVLKLINLKKTYEESRQDKELYPYNNYFNIKFSGDVYLDQHTSTLYSILHLVEFVLFDSIFLH